MEEQIEKLKQQLQEQEKLASLGVLSAGIAHEIQNPLNFVINFSKISQKLLDDLTDIVEENSSAMNTADREELSNIVDDLTENLSKITEHGQRAISIVRGILLISRGKEGQKLPTNIPALVHEYVWLSYHAMRANHQGFNISIREDYPEQMPQALVVPQDLSRAVLNVMNNACYAVWRKSLHAPADYMPQVSVTVAMTADAVAITIADNGEGMGKEVCERLFDNFFTTKPVGHGTGLGMGITRDIIEKTHDGHIDFETTEGLGTTFTLTIPLKK